MRMIGHYLKVTKKGLEAQKSQKDGFLMDLISPFFPKQILKQKKKSYFQSYN